jgi:hypothetical protein
MNYFVHSVMYSYYFLTIIGQKRLAKLIAKQITSLQLLQVGFHPVPFFDAVYPSYPPPPPLLSLSRCSPHRLSLPAIRLDERLTGLSVCVVQMGIGCFVTYHSSSVHAEGGKEACYVDAANYKMGLGMYFSYLVLFAMLFYDKCVSCSHTPVRLVSVLITVAFGAWALPMQCPVPCARRA